MASTDSMSAAVGRHQSGIFNSCVATANNEIVRCQPTASCIMRDYVNRSKVCNGDTIDFAEVRIIELGPHKRLW